MIKDTRMGAAQAVLVIFVVLGAASCSGDTSDPLVEVGCRLNSDCLAGEVCVDSACVEDERVCEGEDCPCTSSVDCGLGEACDTASGECFELECLNDGGCGLGEVCLEGRCETDVDADRDRDGVPDTEDLCPEDQNADQEDLDGDLVGDVCDDDDDNDGAPDTIDNCPRAHNPAQHDANGDGVGNVCDEVVRGWDVVGKLDASAGGNPDTDNAQVFISTRAEPVGINSDGEFVLGQALLDTGPFALRVVWPGFDTLERVFDNKGTNPQLDVGTLALVPEAVGDQGVQMRGVVTLQDRQDHRGTLVRILVGGVPVASTLTDEEGVWVLGAGRVDHTLRFSRNNFLPETLDVVFDNNEGRFEVDGEPLSEVEVALRPDASASLAGRLESDRLEVADWSDQIRSVVLQGQGRDEVVDVQPDGTFTTISNVVPGNYVLDIDARAHFRQARAVILSPGETDLGTVTLTAEVGDENAAVQMRGTATLAGEFDHSGIIIRALIGNTLAAVGTTDPEGGFVLLTARDDHTVEFSSPGFETARVEITFSDQSERFEVLGEALEDFDGIVLGQDLSADLQGQIVTPIENFPVENAQVTLIGDVVQALSVGENGIFGVENQAPGLYRLDVALEGHRTQSLVVELDSGINDLQQISMDPIEVVLAGFVELVGNVDSSDATVRLRRDGVLIGTTVTDTLGRFVFDALPRRYSVSVSKANFIGREVDVEFDGQAFTLDGLPLDDGERPIALTRSPQSDRDADGVIDGLDNCPDTFNPDRRDIDSDGLGDVCDGDVDGDGLVNGLDNCPSSPNPMQEDTEGKGRGTACSLGSTQLPIEVGCGVIRQHLDTRERTDRLQGSCGGSRAPEVVYSLNIGEGEIWQVDVEAQHSRVLYLLDVEGREVACNVGGHARFGGEGFEAGYYRLVVDGFEGEDSAGGIDVSVSSLQACATSFSDRGRAPLNVGAGPESVRLGDVDGDGHTDIISVNKDSDNVSVLLGDGEGQHAPQQSFPVGVEPVALALGDVNGDGHTDIITANRGSDNVSVLLGLGNGTFAQGQPLDVGERPNAVVLGDLDGDGHTDIISVNQRSGDVSVLLGDGEGQYAPQRTFPVGVEPVTLALGDVNGDGHTDIAVSSTRHHDVRMLIGVGDGTFVGGQASPVGFRPTSVVLGDLNGDGHTDIAAANGEDDNVSVVLGLGGGIFAPQQTFPVGEEPSSLALGDTNADGQLDIVTANSVTNDASVLLGLGDGTFAQGQPLDVGERPSAVVLGDLDGDGHTDIAVANANSDDVSVLLGAGDSSSQSQLTFAVGRTPSAMALGDVNGDGHLDIITSHSNGFNAGVLLGVGDSSFLSQRTFNLGGFPTTLALGDVNADGHLDIVTANSVTDDVSVLLGLGDGDFAPQQTFDIGFQPTKLALGDLNGDGRLDIAVSGFFENSVSVMLGLGDGTFAEGQALRAGNGSNAVVLGDLNDDEHLDIAVANANSDDVSVLLGLGDGAFAPQQTLSVGEQPRSLALGDINADGHTDIAIGNRDNDDVSVLLGLGEGAFAPQQTFPVGDAPDVVVLADNNKDGHLDITTANFIDDSVSVLLGLGDGTFAPQQTFPAGDGPRSLALGDINADGRLDIITANQRSDDVSVIVDRNFVSRGTRLTHALLPACDAQALPLGTDTRFRALPPSACRIDRLELDLTLTSERRGSVALTNPTQSTIELANFSSILPASGLLSPEAFAGLARFESHSLAGTWTLRTSTLEVDSAQMLVNTFPLDPFDPEAPSEPCNNTDDQPAEPDFVCRLAGPLEGLSLEDDEDEDMFLLQGDFDGAFIQGQTLTATLTTDPNSDLTIGLHAFRAIEPLVTAEEIEPGLWALFFTVPPEYSGRYFSLHVRGTGVSELSYSVRAEEGEPFEFNCTNGLDEDGNGLVDCADPRCAQREACATGQCDAPFSAQLGQQTGTTEAGPSVHGASCGSNARGPEHAWVFTPQSTGLLCVDTLGSSYDTILHARGQCEEIDSELACNDDIDFPDFPESSIQLNVTSGEPVFLFVDAFSPTAFGDYVLNTTEGACP